jgi:hypothetical protein
MTWIVSILSLFSVVHSTKSCRLEWNGSVIRTIYGNLAIACKLFWT